MQPADVGAKLSTSRSPLGNLLDVQDADKSSETDDMVLHIASQAGKESHRGLSSKTSPACHSSSNFGCKWS